MIDFFNLFSDKEKIDTHKGNISPKAKRILRDPEAKAKLEKILASGEEGTVEVDGKTYRVKRS